MLLFSWVNFQPRQMRAARPPANCWTMTILQPALQNSFGRLFVITAALARKTILTVSRYSALLRAELLNRYTAKNWNAAITRGPIDFPGSCCNNPTTARCAG